MSIAPIASTTGRPGVVERVTLILDAFVEAPGHLLLEEITHITGLPRSTAFRILSQLMDEGWVKHGVRGYALGSRLSSLARRSEDHEGIRVAAHDELNTLSLRTGAVAHLSVLEGGAVHYLDKVGGRASASVPSRVGARIIATDTVSGRALLATLPPETVDRLLADARGRLPSAVEHHTTHKLLAAVRARQGAAVEPARGADGITSVGVPVFHRTHAVAAISLAWRGPLTNSATIPQLFQAAAAVTRQLST